MKISVIIPAYNCAPYIAQTLDGIYTQNFTRRNVEIIVCLDAPTDNTADVVRTWARRHGDMKIRIIANRHNRGVSYSRNVAMRYACGEYIHFMDSDDIINTDFYSALYKAASQTGAEVAVSSYRHQRRPNCSVVFDASAVVSHPQDKIDITRVEQHGMMWRYLVKRDFWMRNKFKFPEDMKICEDWVLANKMVFAANYIVLVPEAMYFYRSRENSLISVSRKQREGGPDGRRANAEIKSFFAANGLQKCVKRIDVRDFQLFGKIRIFTVSEYDNKCEWRLFGRLLLMRAGCGYKSFRKPL